MSFFFWLLFVLGALIPAVFFAYPVLLGLLPGKKAPKPPTPEEDAPEATLLVVVRNGEALLPDKINNSLQLNYPPERLHILFVSDGSTDGTEALLQNAPERIEHVAHPEHLGKNRCLSLARERLRGEIVFLSDADALPDTDALRLLAGHFSDVQTGGVCGRREIRERGGAAGRAQRLYARFDSWIKNRESAHASISSNDGKLYAIRRELLEDIPDGVTDDLYTALNVVRSGHRFLYEPRATASIPVPSRSNEHELVRRRRIVTGSLRGILAQRALLDPRRYGLFAVSLGVNKVLRRLLPLSLLAVLASSLVLAWSSGFMAALLAAQAAAYGLAALPEAVRASLPAAVGRISAAAHYFVLGNLGVLLALWDLALGKRVDKWDPVKDDSQAAGHGEQDSREASSDAIASAAQEAAGAAVAYVMSRFPKVTETFVLYEMLEVERQGRRVEVYPLLRHHDSAQHPEAARYVERAHYVPFCNTDILRSNLSTLRHHPRRYLATLFHVTLSALPSPKFLAATLAIWPKSVHFAQDMQHRAVGHVHAHFATHATTTALIVHRLTDIPYSFTAHAHDIFMDTTMLGSKLRHCRFAVVISEYNRELLTRKFGADLDARLHTIHCGVDPTVFTPRPEQRSPGPWRFICVASYKDMKGHEYLLRACAMLRDRGYDFRCDLVGDGPLREQMAQGIRELELEQQVHMLGALPREEVSRLTREADIAVLASVRGRRGDMEGIPVALMEAMCVGLPVVASRLSGIPELVEDGVNGYLAPAADAPALAEALQRLMDAPDQARSMGLAGRQKVLREFDLRQNAKALSRLFGQQ